MAEKKESLQDSFLNGVRKDKNPVTVFLVNGVKLQGAITWFDNFSINVLLKLLKMVVPILRPYDIAMGAIKKSHRTI